MQPVPIEIVVIIVLVVFIVGMITGAVIFRPRIHVHDHGMPPYQPPYGGTSYGPPFNR